MARFSDSEIGQLKSEVSVERLVEAAGCLACQCADSMSALPRAQLLGGGLRPR